MVGVAQYNPRAPCSMPALNGHAGPCFARRPIGWVVLHMVSGMLNGVPSGWTALVGLAGWRRCSAPIPPIHHLVGGGSNRMVGTRRRNNKHAAAEIAEHELRRKGRCGPRDGVRKAKGGSDDLPVVSKAETDGAHLANAVQPSNNVKHYLMKSEPSAFSIQELEKRPNQTEPWNGEACMPSHWWRCRTLGLVHITGSLQATQSCGTCADMLGAGVRNYAARNFMRSMRLGDRVRRWWGHLEGGCMLDWRDSHPRREHDQGMLNCWNLHLLHRLMPQSVPALLPGALQAFFYHSNCKEPGIVGIVEVRSESASRRCAALRRRVPRVPLCIGVAWWECASCAWWSSDER